MSLEATWLSDIGYHESAEYQWRVDAIGQLCSGRVKQSIEANGAEGLWHGKSGKGLDMSERRVEETRYVGSGVVA